MLKMLCMSCGLVELSSDNASYSCYYCHKKHPQCEACNKTLSQRCGICNSRTIFVNLLVDDIMNETLKEVEKTLPLSNEKMLQASEGYENSENKEKTGLQLTVEQLLQDNPSTSSYKQSKKANQQTQCCFLQGSTCSLADRESKMSILPQPVMLRRSISQPLQLVDSIDDIKLLYPTVEHLTHKQPCEKPHRVCKQRKHKFTANVSDQKEALEKYIKETEAEQVSLDMSDLTYHDEETEQSIHSYRVHAGEQQILWRYVPQDSCELRHAAKKCRHLENKLKASELQEQMQQRMYRIGELERMKEALELQAADEKLALLKAQCKQEEQRLQLIDSQSEIDTECDYMVAFVNMPTPMQFGFEYFKQTFLAKDAIDVRMENVMKTVKENPKSTEVCAEIESIKSTKHKTECSEKLIQPKPVKHSHCFLPCARRAFRVPFEMTLRTVSCNNFTLDTPAPQSRAIKPTDWEVNNAVYEIRPEKKHKWNFSCQPIYCPDSDCKRIIFFSDINKHLIQEHAALTMERISTNQIKTFFLDPSVVRTNAPRCHFLYLVRDKNTNIGNNEFSDLLPVMVMSSRVHLLDICGYKGKDLVHLKEKNPREEVFLLWLMGMIPEKDALSASISVFPLKATYNGGHTVQTSNIYSIRAPQNISEILQSDCAMLITWNMMQCLTYGCLSNNMIGVQVIIN